MTTKNTITFGVELEFLVPFLVASEPDPANDTDQDRPVTRVDNASSAFPQVQAEIHQLLKAHKIPVQAFPGSIAPRDKDSPIGQVYLPRQWVIDQDNSVRERRRAFGYHWTAVELQSPVLAHHQQDSYAHVAQVVQLLRQRFRLRVNHTTGFHVHVGLGKAPLPPRAVHRLAQMLWCADGLLSSLHPPERVVGYTVPSVRLASYLARSQSHRFLWERIQCQFERNAPLEKRPSPRNVRRGSWAESAAIQERISTVSDFPSLRRHAASQAKAQAAWKDRLHHLQPRQRRPKLEHCESDKRSFTYSRMCDGFEQETAEKPYHDLHEYQQHALFGHWEWPQETRRPGEQDRRDSSGTCASRNCFSYLMDTETMASETWAEIMDRCSDPVEQVDGRPRAQPAWEGPSAHRGQREAGVGEWQSFDSESDVSMRDDEWPWLNLRRNPFQNTGARSRHLQVEGIEMDELDYDEWLQREGNMNRTGLLKGLLLLTDADLHEDTRRAAHLLTSVHRLRCNYNFNSYGFPGEPLQKPIMTIEFREATGSMDPRWVATWASVCARIVAFCLEADQDRFVDVLMRIVEAETNAEWIQNQDKRGRPDLPGYDIVSFLNDMDLPEEASYVDKILRKLDTNAFWFPCDLVRKSAVHSLLSPQPVGDGVGVLPDGVDEL